MKVPKSHPRYDSLVIREKLVKAYEDGVLAAQGLIAQGRGESFDYLLGERTIPPAEKAERVAAAMLLSSERPFISMNGNVAVLAAEPVVRLAESVPCGIEVNLFHRTEERVSKIIDLLKEFTDMPVLGENASARIPGLDQPRGLCEEDGIATADTVLVALEDGDRTEALVEMGKTIIAIDLNPLCRTSKKASVTVVDELTRAVPKITEHVISLKNDRESIPGIIESFDNSKNLDEVIEYVCRFLQGFED
ncbi:MAG: phosphopantothenate/pantothenate synthetase [Thermoplasmata archaeon]|nr:phosphopantothenate/pantothenate synthetase [Thermoplasmata archaeon]